MPGNHGEISSNEFDNDNNKKKRKKKKKKKIDVTISDDQTTNQLVMPSIPKSKNRFLTKIRKIPKSPKRCSSPPCTSSSSRSGSSSRKGGCFRVMRPRRRKKKNDDNDGDDDSCVSSPTSDPNDERFSHDMLRVMLETNDFCSNECNPHR